MNKINKQDIFFIAAFGLLYIWVSITSFFHLVDFFQLTNPNIQLAYSIAIGLELGAAGSLSAIALGKRMNQYILWGIFILITFIQTSGNMYYAYKYINPNFKYFIELLGLHEEEIILQKRIVAIIQGGFLPVIALGFIHFLNEYVRELVNKFTDNQIINSNQNEIETRNEEIIEETNLVDNSLITSVIENKPEEISVIEEKIETQTEPIIPIKKPRKPRTKKIIPTVELDPKISVNETPIIRKKNKKLEIKNESAEKIKKFKDRTNLDNILNINVPHSDEVIQQLTKWQQNLKK